jgi:hypothetical protein
VLWGTADTATAEFCGKLTGLRQEGPRYRAHITPETWQHGDAVEVDAPGPQDWDCTAFARQNVHYMARLAEAERADLLTAGTKVTDNDDVFKDDPAAPAWVHAWQGPFTIQITRVS